MQLMMYIGNDLIESMEVNFTRISEPGYLGRFKRILKQRHWHTILQSQLEPEYLVVNVNAGNSYESSTSSYQLQF